MAVKEGNAVLAVAAARREVNATGAACPSLGRESGRLSHSIKQRWKKAGPGKENRLLKEAFFI